MAQTLEEFLVSLKFGIDQSSQQRFFDTMKRVAGSFGGVSAGVAGLTFEITKFADKMAKVGDNLYWMSQRLGDSVNTIQTTAQAMATLGMTTGEAYANMERFGLFMRSYGPAATSLLRQLGVTARDAAQASQQAAQALYNRGLRPGMENSTAYAMNLQIAQLIGLSEQYVRTIPQLMARQAAMQQVANMVWGGRAQATGGLQAFGSQSNQMILQFARLEALFTNIAEKMALNVFPAVSHFIDQIIAYGPRLVDIFDGIAKAMAGFVDFVADSIKFFHDLPGAIQAAAAVFLTLPSAISVLLSPLGMVIAGFTALFLLMADYKAWQWDQAHTTAGHSAFNWGDNTMFGEIKKAGEVIEKFAKDNPWMIGVIAGIEALGGKFKWLGGTVASLVGAAGPIGMLIRAVEIIAAVYLANKEGQDAISKKAEEMGYEKVPGGAFGMPTFKNKKTGETVDYDKMLELQGLPHGRPELQWLWNKIYGSGDESDYDRKHRELHGYPQRQGALMRRGGVQVASLDDSWMPASVRDAVLNGGAGGDDSDLFKMLREKLDLSYERLGDIWTTLTDMADAMGAGNEARSGTGGYGESVPLKAATKEEQFAMVDTFAAGLGIPREAAAGIVSNILAESQGDPHAKNPNSTAYGKMQWLANRFGPLAAWARAHGFDPHSSAGQDAMVIHDVMTNFPDLWERLKHTHDPLAAAKDFFWNAEAGHTQSLLKYMPGHMAYAPSLAAGRRGGNTYNTHITVTAPSPAAAAHQVSDALDRKFQEYSRMTATSFA